MEKFYNRLSVRTIRALKVSHVAHRTPLELIVAGDACAARCVRWGGLVAAVECYRAAGLGVYNIAQRLAGRLSVDTIRRLCIMVDSRA